MATLGEAFIAVKADMSPFRRNLKPEVQAAANDIEKAINDAVSKGFAKGANESAEEAGRSAGRKAGKGIGDELGNSKGVPWRQLANALGSALDDGISALPTELKLVILAALAVVTPVIIAGLAGAIGAGVAAGVVGLGVALGTQFESVQKHWAQFLSRSRNLLVEAAAPFEGAILEALNAVETRLREWAPLITEIFSTAAPFLEKILAGLLDGLGFFLDSLNRGLKNAEPFAEVLSDSLAILGDAVGQFLEIILATGEDGVKAFQDLIFIVADLLIGIAKLIAVFAKLYAFVRGFAQAVPDWLGVLMPPILLLKGIADSSDEAAAATSEYDATNRSLADGVMGVVSATKDEEKALKELEKAIDDANKAALDAFNTTLDWEEAIDELAESFAKNGATLDKETEEGRTNLRNLSDAIIAAKNEAISRYQTGKLNADQARQLYQDELNEIRKIGAQYGLNRQQIEALIAELGILNQIPPPDITWAQRMAEGIGASLRDMQKLRSIWNLPPRPGGPQLFADGGIVRGPTNALIGEAGAEVVIPMTRPARAMQLLEQSGLARMLSSSGNVSVSVFLGNEAFDQHVQKIVVQDNRNQSRQLSFGVR